MCNPLVIINAKKGWSVADGATGTNLFARVVKTGHPPELFSVERPRHISWLHNSFIDAGSDLILTNSFSGNSPAHVVAMVSALTNTAERPFDPTAMTAALGTAWGGVGTSGGDNATCGNRPGRRHQRREPRMG